MRAKYRVYLTEYERGWGSKTFAHSDFDSMAEAIAYRDKENAQNNLPRVPD